jgi:hypothetical protein
MMFREHDAVAARPEEVRMRFQSVFAVVGALLIAALGIGNAAQRSDRIDALRQIAIELAERGLSSGAADEQSGAIWARWTCCARTRPEPTQPDFEGGWRRLCDEGVGERGQINGLVLPRLAHAFEESAFSEIIRTHLRLHFISPMLSPPNTTSFLSFPLVGVGQSHTRPRDGIYSAWLANFA